jgi:MFS family permease
VQGVIGTSAASSGVVLTPMTLGAVATSILTGQLISRTGSYRWNVVFGPVVLLAGMILLWRMNVHTTNGEAARNMVVAGIGVGSMMQVFVISVQNVVPRSRIGSATALTQFSRQMGATLGVTIIGVLVNHGLPPGVGASGEGSSIHRLPPVLRNGLAHAIHPAFLLSACLCVVVWVIAVVFVKEQKLRQSLDESAAVQAAAAAPAGTAVESQAHG